MSSPKQPDTTVRLDGGQRFALMKGVEYFVREAWASDATEWSNDLAKAELYSTRRDAEHDYRVISKRFPAGSLRIMEI